MRQSQAARITTGVWLFQKFKVTDHMLIKERVAIEVFEEIERYVWLMLFSSLADYRKIALEANGVDLVSHRLKCRDDVIFRSPGLLLFLDPFLDAFRRHQLMAQQHEDSELCFGFESHSGIR